MSRDHYLGPKLRLNVIFTLGRVVDIYQILKATLISFVYFILGIIVFYRSYDGAKERGTLINMGE